MRKITATDTLELSIPERIQLSARQDFSRKLKWIRPILAAKNDLTINVCGGPRSSSYRHGTQLRVATLCAMTPVMTWHRIG